MIVERLIYTLGLSDEMVLTSILAKLILKQGKIKEEEE